MSEYQRVLFRAIDAPVSEKNLGYMRRQSSRAEITPWTFDNEYNFSDFRGNAKEMLRRGYDLHLHWANFGVRRLMLRLSQGLPKEVVESYFSLEGLGYEKDANGEAAILTIAPYIEEPDDESDDFDELISALAALRDEIAAGDLRPLYIAHLAIAFDDGHDREETREAPVPAGLDKPTRAQRALADWYGVGGAILTAAAQSSPPMPDAGDPASEQRKWLSETTSETKDAWLVALLGEDHAQVRASVLADYRASRPQAAWPTNSTLRTIAQIDALADEIQAAHTKKAEAKAARERAKHLASLAANVEKTLQAVDKLVAQQGREAYRSAATTLADLREALAGKDADVAELHAEKLRADYPTRASLAQVLRSQGFLARRKKKSSRGV